jgi:GDPmannose 4,6-dehydratase
LDWHDHVVIDPLYYRPTEVDCLRADASKARKQLRWQHSVGFEELVRIMVDAEMNILNPPRNRRKTDLPQPAVASSSEC